jgi:hypothetical protein
MKSKVETEHQKMLAEITRQKISSIFKKPLETGEQFKKSQAKEIDSDMLRALMQKVIAEDLIPVKQSASVLGPKY